MFPQGSECYMYFWMNSSQKTKAVIGDSTRVIENGATSWALYYDDVWI